MTMFTIDYLSRKIRSKNLDFETKVISDQRIKQLYFTLIKKLDLLQAIYNAQFTKKLSQKKLSRMPCGHVFTENGCLSTTNIDPAVIWNDF